jgi:potassium-dependent mechanosensitive channel
MRQLLRLLLLTLALTAPQGLPLAAQETATGTARTEPAPGETELSYDDWDEMAARAEIEIEEPPTTNDRLEDIRGQLAQWRAAFLTAQNANAARITSVREQIAALGPAPGEGETEADDISKRRSELASQLVKLQSPGIAAEEAYRRADGLIREIDRILRERQAQELLQVWPSPINPANWPEAAIGLSDTMIRLWDDAASVWADPKARAEFLGNLPLILVLLVVALALVVYIRRWVAAYAERLLLHATARGRKLWSLLASTGEVILPTLGMLALSMAFFATGMAGDIGLLIGAVLPIIGFVVFSAAWLGSRAFPRLDVDDAILPLPPDRRAEGRFLSVLMGVVLSAEMLRSAAMDAQRYSDATTSVMSFPILVAGGLVLLRLGRILRKSGELGEKSYTLRLLTILARGLTAIGFAGPALAAFGYVQAASALIHPAILSLGLLTALFILQRLFGDAWAVLSRNDGQGRDGLVPVLAGFVMALASLPVFALIWGARSSDITELWTRFSEGFQMGETRISPTDFMVVAIVFVIGYMLTRLLQGALRTTILPKTRMDMGGQTALVAGVGYVGIFTAALVAINAAGLDLSGLAIVAGALSVGIGFGLQTIVSNFISGIILLIERPVSEGDWIEVGGVQGRVRAISVRSTRIETFDRNDVIVPNADLITGRVTNWTRFNLSGRLIVPVAVAQGSDSRQVERILREIAEAQPLAILSPPPLIAFMGYTPTQLNFEIRVILRDVNFSIEVRTDINHRIVERFAAEGVHIVPPPAAPVEPDPVKTAETLVAMADLVSGVRPPVTRGKRSGPVAAVKGAER